MADSDAENKDEGASLEQSSTQVTAEPDSEALEKGTNSDANAAAEEKRQAAFDNPGFAQRVLGFANGFNLYLIGFIMILAIAIVVIVVAIRSDETQDSNLSLSGQELTQETLDELLQSDTRVGDITQTLTVEANAIFNGKILVKDDLDVAGSINVGGPLTLPGITVAGVSTFEEVEVQNNLTVAGNFSLGGALTLDRSLTVNGDGAFAGAVSAAEIIVQKIEFAGDLEILNHIDTGGTTPLARAGAALGVASTVSISGTDTAGTITINTGLSAGAGTLATITFARPFSRTPYAQITPVGATSAGLTYYITRTTATLSIGSSTNAAPASTYVFDYWVTE